MTEHQKEPLRALILAGGLSRRLGGVPKAGLILDGQTLLARTVDAASHVISTHKSSILRTAAHPSADLRSAVEGAHAALGADIAVGGIAVVGPGEKISRWLETVQHASGVKRVQEDPPFSGPAAGIAAGVEVLDGDSGHVLVLACDMPHVDELAQLLAQELRGCYPGQGVMAVSDGKKQPLAAIYPLAQLRAAAVAARAAHRLDNASVFSLVASLSMKECAVPASLTADIDTWADARTQGIAAGSAGTEGALLENHDELLAQWTQKLLEAFEIGDIEVDIHAVLNVAGVAAHSIVRPAAPLTTFVAGLAAGLAAGSGQAPEAKAMKAALGLAKQLAAAQAPAVEPAAENSAGK